MHILKSGLTYFLIVFGAGFVLAFVRIPFLVPQFGVRTAELIEMPIMLAIIAWASRRMLSRHPGFTRSERLMAGLLAFGLLVGAELLLAYMLDDHFPWEYIASRDPVSGSVYLASLIFFAVAPALWHRRHH